jgi:hypothetical protein
LTYQDPTLIFQRNENIYFDEYIAFRIIAHSTVFAPPWVFGGQHGPKDAEHRGGCLRVLTSGVDFGTPLAA